MVKKDRNAIYWKGKLVGYIENLQAEMFIWYGKWVSAGTEDAQLFIDTLHSLQDDDGPLWVGLDKTDATYTVQFPPDEYGSIDLVFRTMSEDEYNS